MHCKSEEGCVLLDVISAISKNATQTQTGMCPFTLNLRHEIKIVTLILLEARFAKIEIRNLRGMVTSSNDGSLRAAIASVTSMYK